MTRQRPVVDLVGAVVQRLEDLRIQQANEKIEGRIVVRDHRIKGTFLLTQGVEIHIVMIRDGLDLRQVERCQAYSGADQDALGSLSCSLFENLILPQGYTFRLFSFHCAEQQVQR